MLKHVWVDLGGDSLVENASESYVVTAEALSNAHLIVFLLAMAHMAALILSLG